MLIRPRVLVALSAVLLCTPAVAQWQRTYAWQGTDLSTHVVAAGSRTAYAFTGMTTIFLRSDDSGETWRELKGPVNRGIVDSLAVDPRSESTIFVHVRADGNDSIYRSTDRGETFTKASDFAGGEFIYVTRAGTIYASRRAPFCTQTCTSPAGITKSEDDGATWSPTGLNDTSTVAITGDPYRPNIVYAAGFDLPFSRNTSHIYRSFDGGQSWSSMGNPNVVFVATDGRSRLYVGAHSGFETPVFRSDDFGETFTQLLHLPDGALIPRISAGVADPHRVDTFYLATFNLGVLRSTDDGRSFKALGDLPDTFVIDVAVGGDGTLYAAARTGIYTMRVEPPPRRRTVRAH